MEIRVYFEGNRNLRQSFAAFFHELRVAAEVRGFFSSRGNKEFNDAVRRKLRQAH
jgi:hypothetical protein